MIRCLASEVAIVAILLARAGGTELIRSPDSHSHQCSIELTYAVGAHDDPKGQCGMSHILEHMMFDGTTITAPGEFGYWIESVGGVFQGSTGETRTVYTETVPSEDVALVHLLERDRQKNLSINDTVLTREKKIVEQEIGVRTPHGPEQVRQVGLATMELSGAGVCPDYGIPDQVRNITVADAYRFYNKHYQSGPSLIVLSGRCSAFAWPHTARPKSLQRALSPEHAVTTRSSLYVRGSGEPSEAFLILELGTPKEKRFFKEALFGILATSPTLWDSAALDQVGLLEAPGLRIQDRQNTALCSFVFRFKSPVAAKRFESDNLNHPFSWLLARATRGVLNQARADLESTLLSGWSEPTKRAELISKNLILYNWMPSPGHVNKRVHAISWADLEEVSQQLDFALHQPELIVGPAQTRKLNQ